MARRKVDMPSGSSLPERAGVAVHATMDPNLRGIALVKKGISEQLVPLALTIAQTAPQKNVNGYCLLWTRDALSALAAIREEAIRSRRFDAFSLPYASLRGMFEFELDHVTRIEQSVGLKEFWLKGAETGIRKPYIIVDDEALDKDSLRRRVDSILRVWIYEYLFPTYAEPAFVAQPLKQRLEYLLETSALVEVQPFSTPIMPWSHWPGSKAAKQPDNLSFRALVDYCARTLAGVEIFPGLGQMRRIVSLSLDSHNNMAILISPARIGKGNDKFSIAIDLEVETMPDIPRPIITMNLRKRRWLTELGDWSPHRSIRGLVISGAYTDRAFEFSANRQKNGAGKYIYNTDNAFEVIKRKLSLPATACEATEIVRGAVNVEGADVLLVHHESIKKRDHRVQAGVPELDKLRVFEAVSSKLKDHALVPVMQPMRLERSHNTDISYSRVLDAATIIAALLAGIERKPVAGVQGLPIDQLDQLIHKHYGFRIESLKDGKRLFSDRVRQSKNASARLSALQDLITANSAAVRRMYPDEKPVLVLYSESEAAQDLGFVKAVAQLLWGDSIKILTSQLPSGVHGPRAELPEPALSASERSKIRVNAWKPHTEELLGTGKYRFCLVLARQEYVRPGNKRPKDDPVNKPSTRQALATFGKASVQFLNPGERTQHGFDLADFINRIQAAIKDLISAHSGRMEGIAEAVSQYFSSSAPPKEIIGITIVRKQTGRRSPFDRTFMPIAIKLDVQNGTCKIKCCYESKGELKFTPWEPCKDALVTVSNISPVRLAEKLPEQRTRFMRFCDSVISESVEEGMRPVVLIDSTNCAVLWKWLKDAEINVDNIEISNKERMQVNWRGARIVRIREGHTPYLVTDKILHLEKLTAPTDEINYRRPTSVPGLYRVSESAHAGCCSYWSVAAPGHQHARGESCLEPTCRLVGAEALTSDEEPGEPDDDADEVEPTAAKHLYLKERPTYIKHWSSPNPIEMVVTIRGNDDDPDQIARFVETLRYGFGHHSRWTSLPGPLFFERVVRDYISAFALEDADLEDESADAS